MILVIVAVIFVVRCCCIEMDAKVFLTPTLQHLYIDRGISIKVSVRCSYRSYRSLTKLMLGRAAK